MNPSSIKKSIARAELARRRAEAVRENPVDMAIVAAIRAELDGHTKAQALFDDLITPGNEVYARCSRRAAKSHTFCRALLAVAYLRKSNCYYFGLTGTAVDKTIWIEVWEPLVKRHFPQANMRADKHITRLQGGGMISFSGTDDEAHIETTLGASAAGGLVVVDELQSQKVKLLDRMLDKLLPPIISDDHGSGAGTLAMGGTITDVPHGRAYNTWHGLNEDGDKLKNEDGTERKDTIKRHEFNRFDNPFMLNQEQALRDFLSRRPNLTIDSPDIQRDWFNKEVFDATLRAWTGFVDKLYPEGNLYEGIAPRQEYYAFACDPGGQDEYAIEGIGWSEKSDLVWHADEWCTKEDERVPLSIPKAKCIEFDNKYHPIRWYYDSNSQNVNDTYTSDFGVMLIKPALKSDFRGQFDRMNDLLAQRRLLIRKGSVLHRDMIKAKLNKKAFAEGGGKPWDPSYHGNCHDAARYTLEAYRELFKYVEKPVDKAPEALAAADVVRELEESANEAPWFQKDLDNLVPDGGSTLW